MGEGMSPKAPPAFFFRERAGRRRRPGFTLIETLVVMFIVALLLSLLVPALRKARAQMLTLKCLSNLRSVAFKFQLFAEGNNAEGHGDSEVLGPRRFYINDFQDVLYRVDEFWDLGAAPTGILQARSELMLCPAGPAQLTKHKGLPYIQAIMPARDVSLAANMRLYQAVTTTPSGSASLAPVMATHVRADILNHPYVPLVLDVDGSRATDPQQHGPLPFYTAPPLPGVDDPYADPRRFWAPSRRHHGMTNVAFVGGHVLSSVRPERESWDWAYQAEVGGN